MPLLLAILHMRRLSAPFLNCFSVSSGSPFSFIAAQSARKAIKCMLSCLDTQSPSRNLTHFDKSLQTHQPIAYEVPAFVALVAILPAAFARRPCANDGKSSCDLGAKADSCRRLQG
ncbi:hypothetical protein JB92DRAFT_3068962 [Gautieria morchelliformis]|nr:hypothetical protein JB92DRAFT_3068962 [Gautieria morchelliformis]